MMSGGMLQGKLPPGSPLTNFTYSSAKLILVCKILSLSDSDGRKKDKIETNMDNLLGQWLP